MQACAGWLPRLQGLTCDCISELCFALLIFADQCKSSPVTSAGFCSQSSHPWIGIKVQVLLSIPLNSFQCDGAG